MIRSVSRLTLTLVLLAGTVFAEEPKSVIDLSDRDLTRADYSKGKLENANLERSVMEFASFADCKLAGANLRKAHFMGASFARANLVGADLTGADARNTGFDNANLSKAILDGANLEGAGFYSAKLVSASLKNAKGIMNLTKSDFTNADLRGADFSKASDYGPNSAIYKGAKYDSRTKFPVGVVPEAVGAVFVKDDPKAPGAAKDNLGTPLRYYKALLYFTPKVTKAETIKLGDFMEQQLQFGTDGQRMQLDKAGKVYQLRIATNATKEDDISDEAYASYQTTATTLSKGVFAPSLLEIHLCDSGFKTVKVVKLEEDATADAKPNPETDKKPDPEPKPDPVRKPESKVEPKVETVETEFGTEMKFRKAQLYYTRNVSKAEAAKLGRFLVEQLNFGRTPLKFQLNKTGSTIELRMSVKPGRDSDAEFLSDCKELGKLAVKNVFPDNPVEVHLCNDELKTLKVVKPE